MHVIVMSNICCLYSFSWSNMWAFVTAGATVALAIIAYWQINGLNKTAREEFLHKLKEGFFTKDARDLITLIENDSLVFAEETKLKDFAIFKINISDTLKEYFKYSIDVDRQYYTTQEIDDFLLGHLEDAGLLLKNNVIGIKDAEQQFEYYVTLVYENKEIKRYIDWARGDDTDIYSNLKFLYEKLKEFKILKS
jgi:hypothetical protein